jgi:hypothetical protein
MGRKPFLQMEISSKLNSFAFSFEVLWVNFSTVTNDHTL